jgi:hypothetical protein
MLYSAAQQFANGYVRAKARSDEDVASFIISSLRRHATTKRVVSIVGKSNTYAAREYTGEELSEISAVLVPTGNAMRDTFAGRMEFADKLIALPPEQRAEYQAVISTGRLQTITEDTDHATQLMQRENEALLDLKAPMPPVAKGDQHVAHYNKHQATLANPDVRSNPALVERIETHCQWHVDRLTPGHPNYAGDAVLLMTNQKPLPTPQPQPGQQSGAPANPTPPGQEAGPSDGAEGPPKVNKSQRAAVSGSPAEMPSQPKNPATGERVPLPVAPPPQMT